MLRYCPKCKEKSVRVKIYKKTTGEITLAQNRVEFCINKGCGYRQGLPNITESELEGEY